MVEDAHSDLIAVVLCGGKGTRLWPLSRAGFPKQFVPLGDSDKTLIRDTLKRVSMLRPNRIVLVASEEHRFFVKNSLDLEGLSAEVILEPKSRNTLAAISLALASSKEEQDFFVICPSDHFVEPWDDFVSDVTQARADDKFLSLFGIIADEPNPGFGYVLPDGDGHVSKFVEKPSVTDAVHLLTQGALWNSGIFCGSKRAFESAFADASMQSSLTEASHALDCARIEDFNMRSSERLVRFIRPQLEAFERIPVGSFDTLVLQKAVGLRLLRFSANWSDVGGWRALSEKFFERFETNRVFGSTMLAETQNSIISSPGRLSVVVGVENLLVVNTSDALFVGPADRPDLLKSCVEALTADCFPEATNSDVVHRPWGMYRTLLKMPSFLVKHIRVSPGQAISLQFHRHRAEHWIVVSGIARFERGEDVLELASNQSAFIPAGVKHRVRNIGEVPLEFIEVQTGALLDENDIVRLEDQYGREERIETR